MSVDIAFTLVNEWSDSKWILEGDSYAGLTWLSDDAKPSEAEIVAAYPAARKKADDAEAAKLSARSSALSKLGLTAQEIEALFPSAQ
jgi:hypothetical protein